MGNEETAAGGLGLVRVGQRACFEQVAFRFFRDDLLLAEFVQSGAEGSGAHGAEFAQFLKRHWMIQWSQSVADALGGRHLWSRGRRRVWSLLDPIGIDQRQGEGGAVLGQLQGDVVAGRSGAVFGGEGQFLTAATHVEIGVAPAVKFAGAAQGLSWTRGV